MARAQKSLLRLVSWNPEAAAAHARELEKAGFNVIGGPAPTKQIGRHFASLNAAAVVFDCDKLPSHSRVVAVLLRTTKMTRTLPLVFAGGEAEKIARIRADMPDAGFTSWKNAAGAIQKYLARTPMNPIQPPAYMDQYTARSAVAKLGFKPGMKIAMLAAPDGFTEQLGDLPDGIDIVDRLTRAAQLALWFVRSRAELESEIDFLASRLPERCGLWIAHPKQSGRIRADFNQNDVRHRALAAGLVDYKVCAIDDTWSALKFALKKS